MLTLIKNKIKQQYLKTVDKKKIKNMVNRWLYSTNAKDISILYFMFALFAGLLGTAFSLIIRMELSSPGPQYLQSNNQYFNIVITAHGVLMIFFMVNSKPILIDIEKKIRHGRLI